MPNNKLKNKNDNLLLKTACFSDLAKNKCPAYIQRFKNRESHNRIFLGGLIFTAIIASAFSLHYIFDKPSSAVSATYTFTQTDWSGGVDAVSTASHDSNQTGWTKYHSASSSANFSVNGQISLNGAGLTTTTKETGIDFQSGSSTAIMVSNSSTAAGLTLFSKKRLLTINNTGGGALTDYQVSTTIDTASLISANKMRSDCGDMRFVDTNGMTVYPHWIESGCNSSATVVWIKVSAIDAASNKTIYLFYGNNYATSTSNVDNVYDLYDDFEDGTISNAKWTIIGTVTESGGQISIGDTADNVRYIMSNKSFSPGSILEASGNLPNTTQSYHQYGFGAGPMFLVRWQSNPTIYSYVAGDAVAGTGLVTTGLSAPQDKDWKIIWKTDGTSDCYVDGVLKATNSNTASSGRQLSFSTYDANKTITIRTIKIRQYSSVEPTVTIGAETEVLTGEFQSAVIDIGTNIGLNKISWSETVPASTSQTIKIRTSNDSGMAGATDWASCSAITNGVTPASSCITASHRYLQYYATQNGISGSTSTPFLENINFVYHTSYSSSATVTSTKYDTSNSADYIDSVSWTEDATLPSSTYVTTSIRTASTSTGLDSAAWVDFINSSSTCSKASGTVTCPSSAIPTSLKDASEDQWVQYKITLGSIGTYTPTVSDISITYGAADPVSATTVSASARQAGYPETPLENQPILPPNSTTTNNYAVVINNGDASVTSSLVRLNLYAPTFIKKIAISRSLDFNQSVPIDYVRTLDWNLCASTSTCAPDQSYRVYVKYYSLSDVTEPVFAEVKLVGSLPPALLEKTEILNLPDNPVPASSLPAGATSTGQSAVSEPVTNPQYTPIYVPPTLPVVRRYLVKGADGMEIQTLQYILKKEGMFKYPQITGYFGPITQDAVRLFQKKYGLPTTGTVGPMTRSILQKLMGR